MKTKRLLNFALFITITVLLSGCGKPNTNLESENADLKARLQKLEQQLQESNSRIASQEAHPAPQSASQQASIQDLKSQLEEAQKKAESAANELTSVNSQVETQKVKIDELTQELSKAQQAREKAEKAMELYQDKTSSAIKQFNALRNTLDDTNVIFDGYHQNYLATQMAVTNLVDALPESKVRREILGVLATFTHVNETWETAARQMQERTQKAQADYDKFVDFGGIGPNDYLIKLGKDKILAPAELENAATASSRDQQMASSVKDIDLELQNLQDLVNGPRT